MNHYDLFKSQGTNTNKSALELPGFDYDFIIRRSQPFSEEKVREFIKDPSAKPLANLWTSILFEIAIANKIPIGAFKSGFVFSDTVNGMCAGINECPIILINPISKSIISANSIEQLVALMEDIAYHELAHVVFRRHDEKFVICSEDYRVNHRIWKDIKFAPVN